MYSDNYSETSGSLSPYRKDDPNDNITDSESFKFKSRFTNSADNAGTANVELAVPFKCFNLWKTLNAAN